MNNIFASQLSGVGPHDPSTPFRRGASFSWWIPTEHNGVATVLDGATATLQVSSDGGTSWEARKDTEGNIATLSTLGQAMFIFVGGSMLFRVLVENAGSSTVIPQIVTDL